jgi:predicted nucleic acid-binding protein
MAVFVDTGIFVAARNRSDNFHEKASSLMEEALRGEFGRICTSEFIVDEAITTALARTHRHDIAVNTGKFVIDSPRIELLPVTRGVFQSAWDGFRKMKDKPVSFTDCTSLALMETHGIEKIMSFDSEFDGLVQRIPVSNK